MTMADVKKRTTLKLPDFVTLTGFVFGFLSIILASYGKFVYASIFILSSVLFDFLDGRLARWLKSDSEIGMQLDSLSDLTSFGVAVAFITVTVTGFNIYVIVASVIFVCAGIYRLARFNVIREHDFVGMPITINGVLFPLLILFEMKSVIIYSLLLIVSSILMVSTLSIKKI